MGDEENRKAPQTVITTHLNADFDAVSSCIAAKLLHPEAEIVLPGSQEREIREFLKEHPDLQRRFLPLRSVDLSRCRRLIIVDTSQPQRIGRLKELLGREGVEVILYDHHPGGGETIEAQKRVLKEVGANATLMTGLLRGRDIDITPEEATILALGIYEDTGSFQFASTTSLDLKEAAWLLERGADLRAIYRLMSSRFTPSHISLLNDLLDTAERLEIRGISITIAKTSHPDYVEDFSIVVHEMMDMERIPVLFVLALLGDQVLVVGRSRERAVDCGRILRMLGGGGHSMAASATLKGVTLVEAEERLVKELYRALGAEPKVADIMSTPVLYVLPDATIGDAHDTLTRFGITVLAILDEKDHCIGLISRRTVEKAIYHGLKDLPVSEYMTTDFKTVTPEDTFSRVQEIIIDERQRFVPVEKDGRCVGVITRTDLLQILTEGTRQGAEPLVGERGKSKFVTSLLKERVPDWLYQRLRELGEIGDELGMGVYVVGGFVRDLLLRRENLDVDIVVEGDGIEFAKALKARYGAKVRPHEKFKTAQVIFSDGFRLDVATARLEYYEYPAAMPTVSLSSLKLDLYRRDFTINTLAIKLNSKEFGLLIDFFGGQRDLKDKVIRVLHSLSFVEDPTRVFRAVRFEQRFGFKIGKHTLRLIKNAKRLNIFERLSGKRLFGELKLILDEQDPEWALLRLKELGLLEVIHRDLRLDEVVLERLRAAKGVLSWYELLFLPEKPRHWVLYLLVLMTDLGLASSRELCARLDFSKKDEALFIDLRKKAIEAVKALEKGDELRPSTVSRLLSPLPLEHQLYALCLSRNEAAKREVSKFITEYKKTRPEISGDDLKAMGIRPGPIYKRILDAVRDARLDGLVKDKEEELAFVREFIRGKGGVKID